MAICNNKKCSLGECDQSETCTAYVPVITNADRIRAMSDEELADFFFESPEIEFTVCEYCQYFGGHTSDTPCKHDAQIDWNGRFGVNGFGWDTV